MFDKVSRMKCKTRCIFRRYRDISVTSLRATWVEPFISRPMEDFPFMQNTSLSRHREVCIIRRQRNREREPMSRAGKGETRRRVTATATAIRGNTKRTLVFLGNSMFPWREKEASKSENDLSRWKFGCSPTRMRGETGESQVKLEHKRERNENSQRS